MSESSNKVLLTLKGKGLAFSKEVDEEVAARIIGMTMVTTKDASYVTAIGPMQHLSSSVHPGIRAYVERFELRRNVDKILAIASYLKHERDRSEFRRMEIRSYLMHSGIEMPTNFMRDLAEAQDREWIERSLRNPMAYRLTAAGESRLSQLKSA